MYSNSVLEQQFLNTLDDPNIKVISFDIFETLAFRKVAKPIDIFFEMGENNYIKNLYYTAKAFQKSRIHAEKKARLHYSMNDEITLKQIYQQLPLTDEQQIKFIEIELNTEKKNLYINQYIINWISKAIAYNKKIILTSDMYLSKENINELILSKLTKDTSIDKIYISSEYMKSKSKNTIFKIIIDDFGINYNNLLHIGDNIKTDVENPKALGINTLHYQIENYMHEALNLESLYTNTISHKIHNFRILSALNNPYEDETKRFFYNYGATFFAPLLWNFSHWLKNVYDKEEATQINFVMREGEIFEKFFKELFPTIPTSLIYASSNSTYLASLDLETFKQEGVNFYRYRAISLDEIYNLHKIQIDNETIKQYKHTLFTESHKIYLDKNLTLYQIFSQDFASKLKLIEQNMLNEKQKFKEYIDQCHVKSDSIIVDFGGTGRLLENISIASNIEFKVNVLFYMHQTGYERMVSKRFISFLPYSKFQDIIQRTPEFIEILFNGLNGTTLGYHKEGKKVIPKTQQQDLSTTNIIESFNQGIYSFYNTVKKYKFKYPNKENIDLSYIITRIIDVPTLEETKYLGSLSYAEGHGSILSHSLLDEKKIHYIKHLGIKETYKIFSNDLNYLRIKIPWLQGVITNLSPKLIQEYKGFLEPDINKVAIDSILNTLMNHNIKKVNVYGKGELFKLIKPYFEKNNIQIISVIDSRANMGEFIVDRFEVQTLEQAINIDNLYPIVIASVVFADDILSTISQYIRVNDYHLKVLHYKQSLINF